MIALRWHVLRLPLLLSLLWCLLLFALFQWTVQREDENATELAQIQTRTLFSSIVNTRGWNADRGGVWATEQPNCQPNPWLPEDQRTLLTADGRRLVRFNPAYMTRQIAERFQSKTMNFHICGLSPKRPQNRPDQWETSALLDFDAGKTERFQLVQGRRGGVLPLYGTVAGGGKLPAMPSEKQNRGRARRHQRIHFRLSHPCLG